MTEEEKYERRRAKYVAGLRRKMWAAVEEWAMNDLDFDTDGDCDCPLCSVFCAWGNQLPNEDGVNIEHVPPTPSAEG